MDENDDNEQKKIIIGGTNNRYQIKKLIGRPSEAKPRVYVERWNIPLEYFSLEKQSYFLNSLKYKQTHGDFEHDVYSENELKYFSIVQEQIEKKISGYKQQDIKKEI